MQSSNPAEVVRALLEADAAGEDPSVYATGDLARSMRVEFEAEQHMEIAAREVTFRRLKTTREKENFALVKLDATYRMAVRQQDGTWHAGAIRQRGRARLTRVGDVWKVVDYPSAGGSRLRSLMRVEARPRKGALELEAAAMEFRKRMKFPFVVRNMSTAPLTVEWVDIEVPVLPGVRATASGPCLARPVVEPGASWGSVVPWLGPYRPRRGTMIVRTSGPDGVAHSAAVDFAARGLRVSRLFTVPRVLEVLGVVFLALATTASWTLFLSGIALLFAGVVRGVYIGSYLRYGSRGRGMLIATALVAAEIVAGTAMLFWHNVSWTTLAVWASLFAYLPLAVHHAGQAVKHE
jgi:hypothetical protein